MSGEVAFASGLWASVSLRGRFGSREAGWGCVPERMLRGAPIGCGAGSAVGKAAQIECVVGRGASCRAEGCWWRRGERKMLCY